MAFNGVPVIAIGLDFDGCVYNENYIQIAQPTTVDDEGETPLAVIVNESLFDSIETQVQRLPKPHLYNISVSNRGNYLLDRYNSDAKTPPSNLAFPGHSSFKTIGIITKYLRERKLQGKVVSCETVKAFPADAYNRVAEGTCFKEAIETLNRAQVKPSGEENDSLKDARERALNQGRYNQKGFMTTVFDSSKISTLYFHVHRLRKKHPTSPIEFYFYDDRADILEQLKSFYAKNPDWFPEGCKVHFYRYAGEKVIDEGFVEGTGIPDPRYDHSLIEMARLCKVPAIPPKNQGGGYDFASILPVDQFRLYRLERDQPVEFKRYEFMVTLKQKLSFQELPQPNTITKPYHDLIMTRIDELKKQYDSFGYFNKERKLKKILALDELRTHLLVTQDLIAQPGVQQIQIQAWITEKIAITKQNHPAMEEGIVGKSDTSELLETLIAMSVPVPIHLPRP